MKALPLVFFLACMASFAFAKTHSGKPGKKYFAYDEIAYYHREVDKYQYDSLYENRYHTASDSVKFGIIFDYIPGNIDTLFESTLGRVNYSGRSIDRSRFAEIDKIFQEKNVTQVSNSRCESVFRDILIFKKRSPCCWHSQNLL